MKTMVHKTPWSDKEIEARHGIRHVSSMWEGVRVCTSMEIVPVTVEEPPIPFSPFSLADCTMLNHFSFNDFIAIAFPDIAGDLDAQI